MSILSKRFQGHVQRVEKIYGVYMFEILDYKVLLYFFLKIKGGSKGISGDPDVWTFGGTRIF